VLQFSNSQFQAIEAIVARLNFIIPKLIMLTALVKLVGHNAIKHGEFVILAGDFFFQGRFQPLKTGSVAYFLTFQRSFQGFAGSL
jgi:hypothetical protein